MSNDIRNMLDACNASLRESNSRASDTFARVSQTPRKAQSVRPVRTARPTVVLIVEDDPGTGELYQNALSSAVTEVFLFPTLAEAGTAIETRAPIDVAVIDLMVPETIDGPLGNGAVLIPLIRARSPRCRILVSTGLERLAAVYELESAGVDVASVELLLKVPSPSELRAVVVAAR